MGFTASLIEDLKNDDYIYVTFYEAPAWSDSGRKGKSLLGIVDNSERRDGSYRGRIDNKTKIVKRGEPDNNQYFVLSLDFK